MYVCLWCCHYTLDAVVLCMCVYGVVTIHLMQLYYVCVRACVRVCVRACVLACVHVRACMRVCEFMVLSLAHLMQEKQRMSSMADSSCVS